VAVTRGLREKLSRDELQGVIAHELSHVKNFDIRFMTLMAVLVGVVVMLADLGTRAIFYGGRGRSRGREGGGAIQLVIILVAIVLAIIAPILARLIQLAASRQREFLADASAARMTRYPEGLARALERLAGDTAEMAGASRATSHLFIVPPLMANGRRMGESGSLWSSHPPIEERVQRLRSLGNLEG
jgi:heat shock protein HtpX